MKFVLLLVVLFVCQSSYVYSKSIKKDAVDSNDVLSKPIRTWKSEVDQVEGMTIEYKVGSLSACLAACAEGTAAIQAFCRTIPLPRIRAACWAVQFATPVVCDGFCYLYFG